VNRKCKALYKIFPRFSVISAIEISGGDGDGDGGWQRVARREITRIINRSFRRSLRRSGRNERLRSFLHQLIILPRSDFLVETRLGRCGYSRSKEIYHRMLVGSIETTWNRLDYSPGCAVIEAELHRDAKPRQSRAVRRIKSSETIARAIKRVVASSRISFLVDDHFLPLARCSERPTRAYPNA